MERIAVLVRYPLAMEQKLHSSYPEKSLPFFLAVVEHFRIVEFYAKVANCARALYEPIE